MITRNYKKFFHPKIPWALGYYVNKRGHILKETTKKYRKVRTFKEVISYCGPKGTAYVPLSGEGNSRPFSRAWMVCVAYHGLPPTDDHVAIHKNGITSDDRVSNLQWGTWNDVAVIRNIKNKNK
jgi:hypothetical protein